MTHFQYLKNVVTLEFNRDKCTGCRLCTIVCPHGVFEMQEKKAQIAFRDNCMECGACQINCPADAIHVESGVGCAEALIRGALTGGEATCDCGDDNPSPCC